MKKVFGILSLIAILTVAFTSQANAHDSVDNEIVFVKTTIDATVDAIAFEAVEVETEFINVAVEAVNYSSAKEGVSFAVNMVGYENVNNFKVNDGVLINYGTYNVNRNIKANLKVPLAKNDNKNSASNKNKNYGYAEPVLTYEIAANVRKLKTYIS